MIFLRDTFVAAELCVEFSSDLIGMLLLPWLFALTFRPPLQACLLRVLASDLCVMSNVDL